MGRHAQTSITGGGGITSRGRDWPWCDPQDENAQH